MEAITRICADEGKVVRVPSLKTDEVMPHLSGAKTEHYAGLTIQSLVYGPDRAVSLLVKRLIDIVGAIVLLIVLAPFLTALALAIWAQDGRPILFHQRRVGLHGRLFEVVKFRTMIRDAERSRPRCSTRTRSRVRPSSSPTIRGSPGSGGSRGGPASTSCRSSGTCSAAR